MAVPEVQGGSECGGTSHLSVSEIKLAHNRGAIIGYEIEATFRLIVEAALLLASPFCAALASSPSLLLLCSPLVTPAWRVPCRSFWRMCPARTLLPLRHLPKPPRRLFFPHVKLSCVVPSLPSLLHWARWGVRVGLYQAANTGYPTTKWTSTKCSPNFGRSGTSLTKLSSSLNGLLWAVAGAGAVRRPG
jgi:hypothetical protein